MIGASTTDAGVATRAFECDAIALTRIPAPTGSEGDRLAWLEDRLTGRPGTRSRDSVGNLVWSLGEPPYALALLAHVDTVFPADVPHAVSERNGWLCGPGIGDNALAVAVALNVVERLAADLAEPLVVVFTVGEEGLGGLRGARHACAELAPRLAIALEGHGLDEVCVDAVGSLRVSLAVSGPGGHSWWDRGRPSATHALVHLLAAFLADLPADVSLNVGRLAGGKAVNAIADRAEALVEGRSLDEERLAELEERLAAFAVEDGLQLHLETLDRRPCGRLDREHPLVAIVRDVRAGLGLPDRLGDGSTDANAALALGIPALTLGCARGADMHTPTERIERSSIALGAAQLDGVLRRLLNQRPRTPRPGHATEEKHDQDR